MIKEETTEEENKSFRQSYEEFKRHRNMSISPDNLGIVCSYKFENGETKIKFKASLFHAHLLLRSHPFWIGRFRWDEFSRRVMFAKDPAVFAFRPIATNDIIGIAIWIGATYGVNFTVKVLEDTIKHLSNEFSYHSCRERILSVELDPKGPKIDDFFTDYLKVKDFVGEDYLYESEESQRKQKLIRAYSRKFFLSSMARILFAREDRPIKVDTSVVVYGEQSIGKSSSLEALVLDKEHFSRTALDFSSLDAIRKIQGKQIYELAEFSKRSKDQELEKAFQTEDCDLIVPKYENFPVRLPRMCVFCITTNRMDILRDSTGSRRYWPIVAGYGLAKHEQLDIHGIKKIAPQLWAQAAKILIENEALVFGPKPQTDEELEHYNNCIWWLSKEEESYRVKDAKLFSSIHPWRAKIKAYLTGADDKLVATVTLSKFDDILDLLGLQDPFIKPSDRTTVEMLLHGFGYRRKRIRIGKKRQIVYRLQD